MYCLLLNPPTTEGKGFIREGRCTQQGGAWTTLWPPITLATIGAILRGDGHRVRAIDAGATGYTRSQLLSDVRREPPDVVIWSTGTPSIIDDLSLAAELKEVDEGLRTAVFGTHVTALDSRCLSESAGLDAIFRNEPEQTAREWVARLDSGESLADVAGLSFRDGDEIVQNPPRPFIDDLDALPDPAWDLFDLDAYRLPLKGTRFLMVTPHRGCPYPCQYCTAQTFYGEQLRKRSPERVRREIETNIERYGVRDFFFWSDTFTIHKSYVTELCRLIAPLGVSWASNSRVDTIDEALAREMAAAGCWMVSFGIESGDQSVLDQNGKKADVEAAHRAVAAAKAAGMKVAGHFVLGLPGETEASLDKTLELAHGLRLDFEQFYCAVPFPGSRLYERARSLGWLASDDFSRFRQDDSVLSLPSLSPEQVLAYRRAAYRRFYRQPRVALGALGLLSPRALWKSGSALRGFLGWMRAEGKSTRG